MPKKSSKKKVAKKKRQPTSYVNKATCVLCATTYLITSKNHTCTSAIKIHNQFLNRGFNPFEEYGSDFLEITRMEAGFKVDVTKLGLEPTVLQELISIGCNIYINSPYPDFGINDLTDECTCHINYNTCQACNSNICNIYSACCNEPLETDSILQHLAILCPKWVKTIKVAKTLMEPEDWQKFDIFKAWADCMKESK